MDNSNQYNNIDIKKLPESISSIEEFRQILNEYGITDINLFGSYARGEAGEKSDVDILCDNGFIINYFYESILVEELEKALKIPVRKHSESKKVKKATRWSLLPKDDA